jgi:uncharacterized protein YhaN
LKLRRIDLAGFGCLRDFTADFAPGLNLVYGMNEAGKSTLQQAIGALLYGFFDNDRVRADETARHQRFRPWPVDGSAQTPTYRGTLEYELEDGRLFEVRRDFSTTDVPTQLIDMVTGSDVAPQFGLGRHGNAPFARKQLGMSRAVFQSCAFIAQGELLELTNSASPQEIGDAIAAMADSAGRDVSATAAVTRLDGLIRQIGRDSARTAELPRAREDLRLAQEELSAHDRMRGETSQKAAALEAAEQKLDDLRLEEARLEVLVASARSRTLSGRLDELAQAEAAVARGQAEIETLIEFSEFPAHRRDRVVALAERTKQFESEAGRCELAVQALRDTCDESARLEFEALRTSAGMLSEDAIAELQGIAYATPEPPAPRRSIFIRAFQALRAVLVRVVRFVLRRSPQPTTGDQVQPSPPTVTREEALAVLDRYHRYLTLRPGVEKLERAEAALQEATQQLTDSKSELESLLGDYETAADFLEGCRKRERYDVAAASVEQAGNQREALLQGRSRQELEVEREECGRHLSTILARHPILEGCQAAEPETRSAAELRRIRDERQQLEIETARLDEDLSIIWRDLRPRAEIEEDLGHLTVTVRDLERRRSAATLAREVIGEAMTTVYRDFAPAVSTFLCEGFEQITEGKYTRAHVDPSTLRVSLLLPETGQEISDPPVSRGTRALAYVLMRMGLAQHMSAVAEPVPLVLDDPFVDFDSCRLQLMLEFLAGVSGRMQVLLFSKDPAVLRWFEERAGDERNRVLMLSRRTANPATV